MQRVRQIIGQVGFPPERLVFEVTEGWVMESRDHAVETLSALRSMGIRIAMDDFGTGYSSLAQLVELPLDIMKIPRVFVGRLDGEEQDRALALAIMALSRSLGLEVIAEGIETLQQLGHLQDLGCRVGQGYLLHRPSPPEGLRVVFAQPWTVGVA